MIDAYPLHWPEGRPRTEPWRRQCSKFAAGFARSRDEVMRQVGLLVGRHSMRDAGLVISTNLALRRDGFPLAGQAQPKDPGVAVYFTYKKRQACFACDRWDKIEDNMHAVALTIDALRGIDRWGTGDMVAAAFRGFAALPPPETAGTWWKALGFEREEDATRAQAEDAYRRLAAIHHPDRGGSHEAMSNLVAAIHAARRRYPA
jgi:hypothetical protein